IPQENFRTWSHFKTWWIIRAIRKSLSKHSIIRSAIFIQAYFRGNLSPRITAFPWWLRQCCCTEGTKAERETNERQKECMQQCMARGSWQHHHVGELHQ